ncbi:MAG: calcium-binding protein, partial [Pseudomonadota bacterium]
IGGAGDDVLEGRFNADLFVFADGFGVDEIRDFDALNALEKIDLADVSDITDFADLMTNHLQVDANGVVRIVVGTDSITLTGVSASDLDASDFIF